MRIFIWHMTCMTRYDCRQSLCSNEHIIPISVDFCIIALQVSCLRRLCHPRLRVSFTVSVRILDIVNQNLSVVILCHDLNVISNMILDQITLRNCTYVILLKYFRNAQHYLAHSTIIFWTIVVDTSHDHFSLDVDIKDNMKIIEIWNFDQVLLGSISFWSHQKQSYQRLSINWMSLKMNGESWDAVEMFYN